MGLKTHQRLFFYLCVVLELRGYSQENFLFDSANVQIRPLNINSKESEFSPFKFGNRLYYTSSRERRLGSINLEASTEHQMLDIYYGDIKDSVTITNRVALANAINNPLHQGTCFFDKNTSKLYYAGNVPSAKTDKYKLAIFSSEFNGYKFLPPAIELVLPDTFVASHPMIHRDKLYFSSNMKGGKGKADLYVAEMIDGKWANIKNLEQLNSPYDDYFPFVINDKEIYFSSNRPGGLGKMDIYKYTFSDGLARINNLGKPINSAADDFGLYMDPKQESGYFSTDRINNQDDIYYFQKTWPTFNDCVAAIKEKYCYDLTDEKSLDTDSLKGYFYEWDFGDGAKQKGISVSHCYLQPGNYVINLNIIDVSTKAVFLNQTALDLYVDSIVQLRINALDTMLVNKTFTINTAGTYLPGKKITGYYFEVDGKRFRKESFEHRFASLGKHKIKLGVEYIDRSTNKQSLMCTTLEVNAVDSSLWVPFEKKKIDEMVAKFNLKSIQAGKDRLEDLNYDAEMVFNAKLGLSKPKIADRIDDYLNSEATRAMLAKIKENRESLLVKNINGDKSGLTAEEEEALLSLERKQKQLELEKAKDPNAKNVGADKYGLSDQEEEALLALKNKQKLYEQEKASGFNAKNIGNDISGLSDQEEDAYLALKTKQKIYEQGKADAFNGKNINGDKSGLTDAEEEAFLAFQKKQQLFEAQKKEGGFDAKNINNDKSGLSDQEEEAFLALQNKKKTYEQGKADALGGKLIGNDKSGLSDQEEEALLALEKKRKLFEQEQAKLASAKNIGNNRENLSDMDEEARLAFKNKNLSSQSSYNQQNSFVNTLDTLLHIDEGVNITFRIHLGKSKEKKDTSYLHKIGLVGVKEERMGNEYVYTYKNEQRINSIEKYYQQALRAGIKDPVVIAYKNNQLIPNQGQNIKPATFDEQKKQDTSIVEKQGLFARLFKKNKKNSDSLKTKEPIAKRDTIKAIKEEAVDTALVKGNMEVQFTKKMKDRSNDTNVVAQTPQVVEQDKIGTKDIASANNKQPEEKPKKKDTYFFPVARKPKDVSIEDLPAPEGEEAAKPNRFVEDFIEKYGESTATDLEYRVQISAFKYRNRYEFPHLANLGLIENTATEGGITRITIGGVFNSYNKALEHNKKVIAAGQKDAFVTVFYKGKRVYLEELEKMGVFLTK
jgi:hypothetical protein